jgi:hypothetical protein
MLYVSETLNLSQLKQIQYLVKQLELNSFRFLEQYKFKPNQITVKYEINVEDYNKLSTFRYDNSEFNPNLIQKKKKNKIIEYFKRIWEKLI